MNVLDRKSKLHLRIEQANDELLQALDGVVEAMFKTYQPEAIPSDGDKSGSQAVIERYEESLRPMTQAELVERARLSNEDIAAGRTFSVSEVKKNLGL